MPPSIPHDAQGRKYCSRCETYKPLEQFYKSTHRPDGRYPHCKECYKQWQATRRDKRKNYEQRKKVEIQQYLQDYYHKNKDDYRVRLRRWRAENPEKSVAKDHRRKAREANAPGSFTAEEWQSLKEKHGFTCLRCGRQEPEIKLTVDHVVPLSANGTNLIDNIQPLCGSCNSSKCDATIDYR